MLEMLKDKKQFRLLEPHHWPQNSLDLSTVDFVILGVVEQNVYRGQRITDLYSLKEAIVEEWKKIPQEIIDEFIDTFNPRLIRVIEVDGWLSKLYWLLIIHIDISQYVFVKFCTILINLEKVITVSVNGSFFFAHSCIIIHTLYNN